MTSITAYLIDSAWIQANLPIAKDVSSEDIKPFIIQSQDFQCQNILGSDLYQRLMNGVAAADLNADETNLIKLIRPAIGYYVLYNALPFFNWKISPKAVMQGTADTANPAGMSEINYLKGYFKSSGDFYAQRTRDYLCINNNLFPEYRTNTGDDLFPDQRSFGASNAIYMSGMPSDLNRPYYGIDPNFTN